MRGLTESAIAPAIFSLETPYFILSTSVLLKAPSTHACSAEEQRSQGWERFTRGGAAEGHIPLCWVLAGLFTRGVISSR